MLTVSEDADRWITLGQEMTLAAEVKKHKVKAIIDTGSNASVISKKVFDDIFTGIEPADIEVIETMYASGVCGEVIPCSVIAMEIPVKLGGYTFKSNFCVIEDGPDLLLGRDFCEHHGVVIDFTNRTVTLGHDPKQVGGEKGISGKPQMEWLFRTWSGQEDQGTSETLDESKEATGYSGDNESNSDETLIIMRSDSDLSDDGHFVQSQALGSEVVPDLSEGDRCSPTAEDSMIVVDEPAMEGQEE